jgi:DNA-binding HxlR family transcriptional regulator
MDMKQIEGLAAEESRRRQIYEAVGMRNTYGLTQAERTVLDIEYAKARAAWAEAYQTLQTVING